MVMDTRWGRICAYLLARAKEPSTWAGLSLLLTAVGVNVAPERWQAISGAGAFVAAMLMGASREGRDRPDNPTLTSTIRGELAPPKPPIVPAAPPEGTVAIDPKHVPVDAGGNLVSPEPK